MPPHLFLPILLATTCATQAPKHEPLQAELLTTLDIDFAANNAQDPQKVPTIFMASENLTVKRLPNDLDSTGGSALSKGALAGMVWTYPFELSPDGKTWARFGEGRMTKP